jgi:UDP-N-acetylglucosamine--N-acetylmuramyl-(pentapeptide) pyrophosphoryl-undecaprenol N-acetylglucosamine transferase
LAVAGELKARGIEVAYAGCPKSMEERLTGQAGLRFKAFAARGFNRRQPWTLITSTLLIARSRKAARQWLLEEKPDAVAAFGGFASLPVSLAAAELKIPLLIQEQNATPGLANRQLARYASIITLAHDSARSGFPEISQQKIITTGNPLRSELFCADRQSARVSFELHPDAVTLLVFGGSLGARHINEALLDNAKNLLEQLPELQVLHIAGKGDYEQVAERLDGMHLPNWHLLAYCDRMGEAYAVADLVLSRAGATSLAELSALGKAALLVPYPYAAADEQTANAKRLTDSDAAMMIKDSQLDEPIFMQTLVTLLRDENRLVAMGLAASKLGAKDVQARAEIADLIIGLN